MFNNDSERGIEIYQEPKVSKQNILLLLTVKDCNRFGIILTAGLIAFPAILTLLIANVSAAGIIVGLPFLCFRKSIYDLISFFSNKEDDLDNTKEEDSFKQDSNLEEEDDLDFNEDNNDKNSMLGEVSEVLQSED